MFILEVKTNSKFGGKNEGFRVKLSDEPINGDLVIDIRVATKNIRKDGLEPIKRVLTYVLSLVIPFL